jgi:hypothetical protein
MNRALRVGLIIGALLVGASAWGQLPRADHATAAAEALFVRSDLDAAKREAAAALKANPRDTRALFVSMEASALDGDDSGMLSSATRLCAAAETNANDEMCEIAAGRIGDAAANSKTFRGSLDAIQKLIAAGSPQAHTLRLALVSAASDGAPEFETLFQSRESGLLTDWKIVGPLGRYPNTDFDRAFGPEQDGLTKKSYGSRPVRSLQFVNGRVELPKGVQRTGVFYAAADVDLRSGGEWRLWVESPGTLEVFIDGKRAMLKDDRKMMQPQVLWEMRRMDDGLHRVVVKFLASALPFRVAIMPPTGGVKKRNNKPGLHAGAEGEYVSVALRYWRRDYMGVVRALRTSTTLTSSAPAKLLLAQAWMRATSGDPAEARAALLAASKATPDAVAVRLRLAEQAEAADRIDEALSELKAALTARPNNEAALKLFAQVASRLKWRAEAVKAFGKLVDEHPSCSNLRDAAWYLAGVGEYGRAQSLETAMKNCGPGSRLYAEWLAQAGRTGAENNAERPPDIANGNRSNPRSAGFFNGTEFYSQFRRDGVQVVRNAESQKFSGGPAVLLLKDKVAEVDESGETAVYVHTITRVLNRDGIEKYGEVTVPAGASILELRTIKPDGTVIEPELNQHKTTISMPALANGDAIELEYVTWHMGDSGVAAHREEFEFVFGSFYAPILSSRFALSSPTNVEAAEVQGAPKPRESRLADNVRLRVWERNDIPQSSNEGLLPREDLLPLVRVASSADNFNGLQAEVREAAIEASRVGPRVMSAAESVVGSDAESVARALYTNVVSGITADGSDFLSGEVTSAEETLSGNEGSRTAALLALARARNLPAELMMAKPIASGTATRYSHPLVVFHLAQRDVTVDAESDGMPFGVLGPGLERGDGLAVKLDSRDDHGVAWVKLPPLEGEQLSLAEGDIVFDKAGSFTARVSITMGAWRAAQMRDILRGIPTGERKRFFEQLAMRLFPGAGDAEGAVENESELNLPLRLEVTCTSPHYLDMTSATLDMDQLVPTLGLRKMFAARASRQFPMLIDTLLFESALFRVRLPDGVRIVRRVADLDLRTEFGSYRATFTPERDGSLVVRREFRIPVQIVRPNHYSEFAAFANRIDDTERQRLTLGIDRASLTKSEAK